MSKLPDARQQSEEEEEAVALSEGRQEGKDAVQGQRHNQTATPAQFISQTPPQEGPHHHAQEDHQTCRQTEQITGLRLSLMEFLFWVGHLVPTPLLCSGSAS